MPSTRIPAPRGAMRRALVILTLLILAGLAGTRAEAQAPLLVGDTDCPWGAADCNRCVPDVVASMNSLRSHGDLMGFRLGDAPDPTLFHHWEGIARLMSRGGRYLAVSRATGGEDVMFVVVEMASRDTDGRRFRSNKITFNGLSKSTVPPAGDTIILTVPRLPEFEHAGGMSTLGNYLAVPLERSTLRNPQTGEIVREGASRVLFFDMADPTAPRKIDLEVDHTEFADAAGAILIARLANGRILFGIGRGGSKTIDFYVSNGSDLESSTFIPFYTWNEDERHSDLSGDDDYGDYQTLNVVTQCDGTLFMVGTHKNLGNGRDFADTWRLDNGDGNQVEITKVSAKHLICDNLGDNQCNLDAAAGVYLDPDGQIYVYSTEHDNDGPGGSIKMEEFRPVPHAECTSIHDAWIDLHTDNNFGGRSLMIDYVDRNRRDYSDYDHADDFGDAPSSARFCLPVGVTYRLWQHHGFDGDHRDLVGSGTFDTTLNDFHDLSFDDETSSSEWIGGPFADAGPDQTVECEGARTAAVVDGTGSSDVNNAPLAFHWTSTDASFESSIAPVTRAHFLPGTATATLTVTNPDNVSNTDSALLRSEDTRPPVIACPAAATVECTALGGTPASDAGVQAFLNGVRATDACDISLALGNSAPPLFPLGTTPVDFSATDDASHTATCTASLTVVDTTGPTIDPGFALSPNLLRVPDHSLVPIEVRNLITTDACQPDVRIECSVSSNESPEAQSGDGHALPDIVFDGVPVAGTSSGFRSVSTSGGAGSFTLALRAERNTHLSGRVYTVTCRATDASGNTGAAASATVLVPLNARKAKESVGPAGTSPAGGMTVSPTSPSTTPVDTAPPRKTRRAKESKASPHR